MSSIRVTPSREKKRPYGWLILLVIISLVLTTVYAREGESGPLHHARVAVQTVVTPVGNAGEWVMTPLRNFAYWISDLGVSRSELQDLRAQNADLRAQVVDLQEQVNETSDTAALTKEAEDSGYKGVTATVIGLPTNAWEQVIVVSKGVSDGIKLDMPVLGPNGLLGQVVQVGPNYAKVRLITDQKSGIASYLQRNRISGITRGSISGDLSLDFVSMEATVVAGDTVITSGVGGVFPKGLVIGQVRKVDNQVNTLYRSVAIEPANDMATVESVIILTDTAPATNDLPAPIEDSADAAKGKNNDK